VNDPSTYSLDGKCGSTTSNKKCGGKWGNCCGKTSNRCGSGEDFCGTGNCQYGNCNFTPPSGTPQLSPLPFYYTGNTTDGSCGPAKDNKVCNVAWGFCCASTGKCGIGPQFCGTGCIPAYGNCTTAAVNPSPKPGDLSPGELLLYVIAFRSLILTLIRWHLWREERITMQRHNL
jgi:hypothetical protein